MLAVGRPLDVITQERIDVGHYPVADLEEVRNGSVVRENSPAVVERMGVFDRCVDHRCPADMGDHCMHIPALLFC